MVSPDFEVEARRAATGTERREGREMIKQLQAFMADESGATAIEYGLIAALISAAGMATMNQLGENMIQMFTVASETLDNANN